MQETTQLLHIALNGQSDYRLRFDTNNF